MKKDAKKIEAELLGALAAIGVFEVMSDSLDVSPESRYQSLCRAAKCINNSITVLHCLGEGVCDEIGDGYTDEKDLFYER